MGLRNPADRYGAVPRSLHWITVILVLIVWAVGMFEDVLPKGEARAMGLVIHITAGLAILVALAFTHRRRAYPALLASLVVVACASGNVEPLQGTTLAKVGVLSQPRFLSATTPR
jgi:hypothetical protein